MRKYGKKILAVAISTFIFLLVLEMFVRLSGKFETLSEKTGNVFLSLFEVNHDGVINKHAISRDIHISNSEFAYIHRIDSLGFRNVLCDSCSILALGDSFTEGLGAPQDSTWPSLLGNKLSTGVYNAGIMGSDPVYGYKILTENYLPFRPKQVIFAVNYSDIADVVVRGGKERFSQQGNTHYHKAPWFMPIYRHSHLFRATLHLLLGYDYMFNSPKNRDANIDNALLTLTQILTETDDWCKVHGINMKVYVHPVPQEYYMNLDRRLNFQRIDELVPMLRGRGVNAVNLRPEFEKRLKTPEEWKKVSWQVDGHYNSSGYEIMAQLIFEDIE